MSVHNDPNRMPKNKPDTCMLPSRKHIRKVELLSQQVNPLGCPLKLDPDEDFLPDHHSVPCDDPGCSGFDPCDKGYCFTGETPVWIDGGLLPIRSVRQGHETCTGGGVALSLGVVAEVETHSGAFPCRSLVFANGDALCVVADHRILLASGAWRAAPDLRPGDQVATADGALELRKIGEETVYSGTVYNLKIGGGDSYMVGKSAVIVRDH